MKRTNVYFLCLSFVAALALYFVIEPNNLSFAPDSMSYLEMAESFSNGDGITDREGEVIAHWPPAFPISLSLIAYLTGSTILEAGKLLQPALLFCFLILFLFIFKDLQLKRSTILLSGLLLIASQLVKNFLAYLSEGLFLVFLLLSFYLFLKWIHLEKRKYLIYTGLTCGILFLTRYAAVGFIGAYLMYLLIRYKNKPYKLLKHTFYLVAPIFLVILPWFLYLMDFDNDHEGRKFEVHLISLSKLSDLFITVAFWFLGSILARVIMFFLVGLYVYKILMKKFSLTDVLKNIYHKDQGVILITFLFIIIYPLFLIASISFYDDWTPLDNRMLSPIFPFVIILIALLLDFLTEQKKNILFYSTGIGLFLSFASSVIPAYLFHYRNGGGYNKTQWRQSGMVKFLKKNEELPVYSNGAELGILHVGRHFELLPLPSDTGKLRVLSQKVRQGKAQIVFFDNVNWRNYLISKEKLLEEFHDLNEVIFEDGVIIKKSISE